MNKPFTKPTLHSDVLRLIDERGISHTQFVSTVESYGGSRNAAYRLTKGVVTMHATTMLVIAHILEEPVDSIFWLEYEDEDEPFKKESTS